LTTLTAPAVISIGEAAFLGSGLQSVSLPLATAIGDSAFLECLSLVEARLPSAATIGRFAFATDGEYYGTPTLTLEFGAAAPAVPHADGVFGEEADAIITVLVPAAAVANYDAAWQNAMSGASGFSGANSVNWTITGQ
ncbi:MAG: leucine-rich repeat domain-containing protein, partial [Spirochaetaceae bacterium]|nr:leucine-rich repeat domain-containing protein [Spirochaetaceae bacterium]